MKLSDVTENSKGIDSKILKLIDLKTEDDMRQLMTELRSTNRHLQSMEKKFDFLLWFVGGAFVLIAIFIALKK